MPLEELLAIYRYEASAGSSIDSSSGDLTDELPDMTLDKVYKYITHVCRVFIVYNFSSHALSRRK